MAKFKDAVVNHKGSFGRPTNSEETMKSKEEVCIQFDAVPVHGIFEAASEGKLNIDPKAWSPNGTDPSPFPAQVKVRVRVRCEPLPEENFSPVISENYKDEKMFWFELDRGQTNKLLRLFSPSPSVRAPSTSRDVVPTPRKPIPASSLAQIGEAGATRVDKWSNLFKPSDEHSSRACNGVESSTSASQVPSFRQDSGGFRNASKDGEDVKVNPYHHQQNLHPTQKGTSTTANNRIGSSISKEDPAEDTYSVIDWDAASSFQVHLDGLNKILEDPKDKDGLRSFVVGNMGAASSSMVPNPWEDEKISWDFEERSIAKSPCGSSYVSANTGDAVDDIGRMDQFKMETGSPIVLQLESRREILRLKGSNGS